MERIAEPELMLDAEQARAYAAADFEAPHSKMLELLRERIRLPATGHALDLGCGPADIAVRFAAAHPGWQVDGIDGSSQMLGAGRARLEAEGLSGRVRLHQRLLPTDELPRVSYELVISNSLLHHLAEPAVLWRTAIAACAPTESCGLFVMDLMRPETNAEVDGLVARYAADKPEILRRDFRASLHAAYRPDEVRAQVVRAGLAGIEVETVSDRHWIAWGTL